MLVKYLHAAAGAAAVMLCAAVAAPIPAELMWREDRVEDVSMSPDGSQIAVLVNGYGAELDVLRIVDLATLSVVRSIDLGEFEGHTVDWANNDRVLLTVDVMDTYKDGVDGKFETVEYIRGRRALTIDLATGAPTIMFEGESGFVQRNRNLGRISSLLRKDPLHVMMPAWDARGFHLWKVNVETGEAEISERGNDKTVTWYTDGTGRAIMRFDISSSFRTLYVYGRQPDGDWKRIEKVRIDDSQEDEVADFSPLTVGPDEGTYYVLSHPEDEEFATIKLYDVTTGEFVRTVHEAEDTDITGAVLDVETRELIGYTSRRDRLETTLYDDVNAKHLDGIDAYFKRDANIRVIGGSATANFALLYVTSPTIPGDYYVYDYDATNLQFLFSRMEGIAPDSLGRMSIETYTARDGTELSAYVTQPPGVSPGDYAPLIVRVHGGPEQRDVYDFRRQVQFLASRGYRVVQSYFRGSSGRGRSFGALGYGEWGGLMQDDVTDAIRHWQADGRGAPETTCVIGASYGGFAALSAAGRTPELLDCAASVAGVTDLVAQMAFDRDLHGRNSEVYAYLLKSIGEPRDERRRLDEISPVNLVDQIEDPIFLAHGERDRIVPVEQSEDMHTALRRAGKEVEYHHYDLEGHSSWDWRTEIDLNRKLGNFLDRHVQK